VDPAVQQIIDDLTRAAEEHDARQADRLDRWRVLEPDAGRFLWFLVQALRATTIIEVGTSRGVSTLWLAAAARATGGRVVTIDTDATAQEAARRSVEDAGLADLVSFRVEDGGAALAGYGDGEVDLLFLDAERTEYPGVVAAPVAGAAPGRSAGGRQRHLAPRGDRAAA
jgi:predicted O-methyltransferase YrrM